MKKTTLRYLSLIVAVVMMLGALAACGNNGGNTETGAVTSSSTTEATTESTAETTTETDESTATETTEAGTSDTETAETGETTSQDSETTDADTSTSDSETGDVVTSETEEATLTGEYAEIIEVSNDIKNGVNPYYTDATRTSVTIDNQNMTLKYNIAPNGNMQIENLSTRGGCSYIENTMDVILNMQNGNKYYASKSLDDAILNIYRYGFYYYENRIEGQTFMNEIVAESEHKFDLETAATRGFSKMTFDSDGTMNFRMSSDEDPQMRFEDLDLNASDYKYLELVIKTSDASKLCELYMVAGSAAGYSTNQRFQFSLVAGEEYQTVVFPLADSINDYTGKISKLRLDINAATGAEISIKSLRLYDASYAGAPETLSIQRSFLTYSTKLHHLVQLSTTETVEGVASVDFVTRIAENKVAKLVVKDADGLKYTLEGVDWNTVEYVGFDIVDAGIFGYVLPFDDQSGKISVTLENGAYTVIQSKTPENGKLIPSAKKTHNANDFFMGQRIYTDENHEFDTFIYEAEIERNPLTEEHITVDTRYDKAAFKGYNALKGYYEFNIAGGKFTQSYYGYPNRQYRVSFTVSGVEEKRMMYFATHSDETGGLECAVLLGKGDLLLPVPVEVCKNFDSDGDNTIYNIDDTLFSEAFFPLIVNPGDELKYTCVNLYQNWGLFPLKQISSIQYHVPFYHLSTGVIETNCIVPFTESGPGLPDHRAMSAPLWPTQPQHTSGGSHTFLHYKGDDGKLVLTDNKSAFIDSYGPTYADITLGYLSADNKIETSYHYMEMPQTDENRTYLELSYKFLEDMSFTEFWKDFIFYRCTDNNETGRYQRLGYLDENNESQVVDASLGNKEYSYVLGNDCPYFTLFDMKGRAPDTSNYYGYVNIGFLIYNHEVICNGEKLDVDFKIRNVDNYVYLSLDLEDVSFKAGDTIQINAIMMPWGSHELEAPENEADRVEGHTYYDTIVDGVPYMDKNVRDVRENTLKNPVKLTPAEDCNVIESTYLPKIRSNNGESAEFTISGGHNNIAVRVYGFNKLTVPTIQEYVGGRWVTYKVMSAANKDAQGYGYMYDGYMVYYDGDGTYSYSFIIEMDNGAERKFRVSTAEDYKAWPEVDPDMGANTAIDAENDPINVYVDAKEIASFEIDMKNCISSLELIENDTESYLRIFANSGAGESFVTLFKADDPAYADLQSTGRYLVFKYRLDANSPNRLPGFEFFTNTERATPEGPDNLDYYNIKYDGEWHVVIIDIRGLLPHKYYVEREDKTFKAQFLRFDFFNTSNLSEEMYIDIAYVGLSDSLQDIYKLNEDMDEVTLAIQPGVETVINPKTGMEVGYEDEFYSPFNVHLSAKRLYGACDAMSALFTSVALSENNDYVRMYANKDKGEAYVTVYASSNPIYENLQSTGQYVVFKYRLPGNGSHKYLGGLEMFAGTESGAPTGPDNTDYYMMKDDGEWHVVVFDMAQLMPAYVKEADGSYKLRFLRFDFFGAGYSNDYYMDVAYIAITDDFEKILEYNADADEVMLLTSTDKETAIDPATGLPVNKNDNPFNFFVGPESINNMIISQSTNLFTSHAVSNDGKYIRMYAKNDKAEGYAKVFNAADAEYSNLEATGKYVVFKYRLPSSHANYTETSIQFYANTESTSYAGDDRVSFNALQYDDEWHVVIIDATKMMPQKYMQPNDDGVYKSNFLRFDFYNGVSLPNDYYIDYEYVAMCDDLAKAYEYNSDMSEILLVEGPDNFTVIDPATGLEKVS